MHIVYLISIMRKTTTLNKPQSFLCSLLTQIHFIIHRRYWIMIRFKFPSFQGFNLLREPPRLKVFAVYGIYWLLILCILMTQKNLKKEKLMRKVWVGKMWNSHVVPTLSLINNQSIIYHFVFSMIWCLFMLINLHRKINHFEWR